MKNFLLTIFLCIFIVGILISDVYSIDAPLATSKFTIEEFVTKDGCITVSNEVKISLMDGQMCIITGSLVEELRQLSGLRVRVSGTLVKKNEKDLTGYYNILRYTILEDGLIGNIRQSGAGILLIGEDHVVYEFNAQEKIQKLRELINCKVFMRCSKDKLSDYKGTINTIEDIIFLHQLESVRIGPYVTFEGDAYLDGSEPLLELILSTEEGRYFLEKLYIGNLDNIVVTGVFIEGYQPYAKGVIEVEKYSVKTSDPQGTFYLTKDGVVLLGDNQVVYRVLNNPSYFKDFITELPTHAVLSGRIEYVSEFEATIYIISCHLPGEYYFRRYTD